MEEEQMKTGRSWKRHFTTVTPFSKVLAMILFVTLPIIGFWLGVQYGQVQPEGESVSPYSYTEQPTEAAPPTSVVFPFEQEVYSDLEWSIGVTTDPIPSLYVSDTPKVLDGTVWQATREVSCDDEHPYEYLVLQEYARILERDGWQWEWEFDSVTLQGLAADGPTGSVVSYVNVVDDIVSVITLSHLMTAHGDCEFYEPDDASECLPWGKTCPFTYDYKVFISDPVALTALQDVVQSD